MPDASDPGFPPGRLTEVSGVPELEARLSMVLEEIRAANLTIDRRALLDELRSEPVMGIGSDVPVGRIPVRTEVTVLPHDEALSARIGWTVREYLGSPVYRWTAEMEALRGMSRPVEVDRTPITVSHDVWPGMQLAVPWNGGYMVMTVEAHEDGGYYGRSDALIAPLLFDEDDRHCWTVGGFINTRGLERLSIRSSEPAEPVGEPEVPLGPVRTIWERLVGEED